MNLINRKKILIVDDSPDFAKILAVQLAKKCYDTRTAHSGSEALSVFFSFEPDIVFLDLGLPDIDGYTVCRAIRNSEWGKTIRIFALTGWAQDNHVKLSENAGFDKHIIKPINTSELFNLIQDT